MKLSDLGYIFFIVVLLLAGILVLVFFWEDGDALRAVGFICIIGSFILGFIWWKL